AATVPHIARGAAVPGLGYPVFQRRWRESSSHSVAGSQFRNAATVPHIGPSTPRLADIQSCGCHHVRCRSIRGCYASALIMTHDPQRWFVETYTGYPKPGSEDGPTRIQLLTSGWHRRTHKRCSKT